MQKYVFKPYNKNFPDLFSAEKNRIQSLANEYIQIEHVGSTAIPELGGKGIIDIAVASDKDKLQDISNKLQELGYEFIPLASTEERLFHKIDLPDEIEGVRRYHIHLTYLESKDWLQMIKFRDYLVNHIDERQKYSELKEKAANDVNEDGEKYRKIKEPLIQEILNKALTK